MTLLVNILRSAGEKERRTLNQCRLFMKWTHRNLFWRLFHDSWWVVSHKNILQCRCTLCLVIMTLNYLNYRLCLINREDKTHSSSASLFNHQWKYSLITIKKICEYEFTVPSKHFRYILFSSLVQLMISISLHRAGLFIHSNLEGIVCWGLCQAWLKQKHSVH